MQVQRMQVLRKGKVANTFTAILSAGPREVSRCGLGSGIYSESSHWAHG